MHSSHPEEVNSPTTTRNAARLPAEDDPSVLEALANEYMHQQSLDYYSSVYGIQLGSDPVDVPRQEQIEFDDDYFTSIEKAKYEYPKPVPRPGDRTGIHFKWQQGGLLGRGSFGCVSVTSDLLFADFTRFTWV